MAVGQSPAAIDIAIAMLDPKAVFGTPQAVIAHATLTAAQKIAILRRWPYDVAEISVAVEEGMPGDDPVFQPGHRRCAQVVHVNVRLSRARPQGVLQALRQKAHDHSIESPRSLPERPLPSQRPLRPPVAPRDVAGCGSPPATIGLSDLGAVAAVPSRMGLDRLSDPTTIVVAVESVFVGAIDRLGPVVGRAVLDRLPVNVEADGPRRPVGRFNGPRRDENLLSSPPVLGIDHQIVNAPVPIFEQNVGYVANLAIARVDVVAGDFLNAAQMSVTMQAVGNLALPIAGVETEATGGKGAPGIAIAAHVEARRPIGAPAIVVVEVGLHLT